ncbi:MAG: DUF896 domain-containing protein [Firmicutes bacterium]|nr:DUF896 domain-containing protein [Bacillota bacterium]
MITKELVDRINWLARKQRSEGLTESEKAEQHALRLRYLEGIRAQVVDAMDAMGVKPKEKHTKSCSCPACRVH